MDSSRGLDYTEGPPWMPLYQRQATHLKYATESDARAARVLDWGDLQEVLHRTCKSPPVWGGDDCGSTRGCTSCKLKADDMVTNPLRSRPIIMRLLPEALRRFDRLAQDHDQLQVTLLDTAKSVLSAPGALGFPRPQMELLQQWGYVTLIVREALEHLFCYHIPLEEIVFRTVMINIAGRDALRYQILYDPGPSRLRFIPRSACALGCLVSSSQPSKARMVEDLLSVLMGVNSLCFYYPGALPYSQRFLASLSTDIAHTVMASIRMTPVAPYIHWGPRALDPGEAGLSYSPRLGPLLTEPTAPRGLDDVLSLPRLLTPDSDISMPQANGEDTPTAQAAPLSRPS